MYKRILHYFLILLLCLQQATSYSQNIGPGVKRILFLGNSITWQGNYVNDVEAFIIVHYPQRHFHFINAGLPSETVSGLSEPGHADGKFPRPDLHERLQRVLAQTKPDLVFACYGMNDGIYMPFDSNRFQKFKDGITWMHDEIAKTGARLIHLTPPDYDELKGRSIGYSAVLDRYSNWLLDLRSLSKWEVIDIHYPMKKFLNAHRRVDAEFALDGFAIATDGIHPNEVGHWIIARQILLYLGCRDAGRSPGIVNSLSGIPSGAEILKLIVERQNMMRDAWLTATKYKRPGLPEGLPLNEAETKSNEMEQQIRTLIENKKAAGVH